MGSGGVNITYIQLLLQLVERAIFDLCRVKNNTLVQLDGGSTGYEDSSHIYAGKEQLWTDLSAFILPKGSPLMASVILLRF